MRSMAKIALPAFVVLAGVALALILPAFSATAQGPYGSALVDLSGDSVPVARPCKNEACGANNTCIVNLNTRCNRTNARPGGGGPECTNQPC